ncbi:MAG: dephospho-CoA kinase [Myxococcaceae bacterium]
MKVLGLTGGIASGKSTVSAILRELGAHLIDADVVAREVVEPGEPALEEIGRHFPGVLGPDGRLDRAKLGERIFGNDAERRALNAITHPRIQQRVREKTLAFAEQGVDLVIYDAPLLIENRVHEHLDGVILVAAPRELQIQRLAARNGMTREQAEARIASQLPLDEKRRHATWVVENSGSLEDTRRQVEEIWTRLHANPPPEGTR